MFLLVVASLHLAGAATGEAAPSDLDPSFGGEGIVRTPVPGPTPEQINNPANAVALQPDGRIVAAGGALAGPDVGFMLARYEPDGSLDETFGGDGVVLTGFGWPGVDVALDVVVQGDGKIVAAGSADGSTGFALARYNADGTLDTAFNGGGTVTTAVGTGANGASAVALVPDGRIVAGGSARTASGDFAAVRYQADGTLDTSFGGTGVVTVDIAGADDIVLDAVAQPDQSGAMRTVLGGFTWNGSDYDFAMMRLDEAGARDVTFGGGDGVVTTDVGTSTSDVISALASQGDGRIVAAGRSTASAQDSSFALARYNLDGSLDSTFGGDGTVTTNFDKFGDVATGVAIRPDERIVAVGTTTDQFDLTDFAMASYLPNGEPDTAFAPGGTITTRVGSFSDGAADVALQPDGRIVVAGASTLDPPRSDFVLVRYIGDQSELSVADVSVTESDESSVDATFTVSLSPAAAVPVTVAYATADGSAAAPADYTATAGTLTFAPGETAKEVRVAVTPDDAVERSERFHLDLSNPVNAHLSEVTRGSATILDDDAPPPAEAVSPPLPTGYRLVSSDGGVFAFGDAVYAGSAAGLRLRAPIVGLATSPTGRGYWMVAADGGVFAFGDAVYAGSAAGLRLQAPVVGVAATATGRGYWLVAADGGVFAFGDAVYGGSAARLRMRAPVVGLVANPTGRGYWLVAADGGVFTFAGAFFAGSTGALRLNAPVVGLAATSTGRGYVLAAADGGVFAFGDARFAGSAGAVGLNKPVVGVAGTSISRGYRLGAADGGVFAFGGATFAGSAGGLRLNAPIVGIAT